nr:putative nuclease HARBI1 [Tanacetum cinerariifolium]
MNQNQIGRTVFDIDEETDAIYLQKAIEYHEWLLQQEAQPRLTRTPIFRDREDAERRPRVDYFDDHCKYPLYYFRRRFRMNRKLFLRIANDILSYTANPLPQHFHFFTSRLDCTGRMSISAFMKCRAAIRQFAYGSTADAFDEYLQMKWASFVKSFTVATDPRHTYFKQRQESARKDVERAFGVNANNVDRCETQRRKANELRDRDTHIGIQQNLMKHIWREVEEASEED